MKKGRNVAKVIKERQLLQQERKNKGYLIKEIHGSHDGIHWFKMAQQYQYMYVDMGFDRDTIKHLRIIDVPLPDDESNKE